MATPLPTTMRAAQWTSMTGGIEKSLDYTTTASLPRQADSLPPDSTLVKVAYASPNPVDYKLPENFLFRSLAISKPAIPCGDFAGTVVATTSPHFKSGDRVFGRSDPPGFGAFAEYVVLRGKEAICLIPPQVSMSDASTVGVAGLTAYQCLAPNVQPGSKVFINGGSGGTGTYGIQMAKAMGCSVTTTCSMANVELCRGLGADEVIDYKTTSVVEHLKKQGLQYDLLIDNVDSPEVYWSAHNYLKPGGRYVTIAGSLSLQSLISMVQMLYLPTWLGGGKREAQFLLRKSKADDYEKIAEWMANGQVRAVVEKVYDLENARQAFAQLKTGRSRGKLVVEVAGE